MSKAPGNSGHRGRAQGELGFLRERLKAARAKDDGPEARQARRDLLAAGAGMLRDNRPMPAAMRVWLADGLAKLHTALDTAGQPAVNDALRCLGRRGKGRQAKGSVARDTEPPADPPAASPEEENAARRARLQHVTHPDWASRAIGLDMEIAAAAAVLAARAAPDDVAGVNEALAAAANVSVHTVRRAREDHLINMGEAEVNDAVREELREVAEGLAAPLLMTLRALAQKPDARVHVQIRDLLLRGKAT
jgi:hypothetical protein